MRKKYKYILSIILVLFTIKTLLGGTIYNEENRLENQGWCKEVKSELLKIGTGWPIANNGNISEKEAKEVHKLMGKFSKLAKDEDLEFASAVWSENFGKIFPYLVAGDVEGFNKEISEIEKEEMLLANISISNICQWEEWDR